MIYLVAFALTGLIAFSADKVPERFRWACKVLSIMPLCVLSALRADTVGQDVPVYVIPSFYINGHKSILDVLTGSSPLFNLVAWVGRVVFDSRFIYLFALQAIIIAPMYAVFYRRAKADAWIAIVLYDLVFYSYTLNLVRQSCAVSLVFLASQYLLDGNYGRYLILQLLAFGFHETALVGFAFPFIYYALVHLNNVQIACQRKIGRHHRVKSLFLRPRTIVLILSVLMVLAVLLLFDWLVTLKDSYSYQASHSGSKDYKMFIAWSVFAFELWLIGGRNSSVKNECQSLCREMYGLALQAACVIYLLSYKSVELFRLSLYLFMSFPLYTAVLYANSMKNRRSNLIILALLGTALFFWFWKFVCQDVASIMPYALENMG